MWNGLLGHRSSTWRPFRHFHSVQLGNVLGSFIPLYLARLLPCTPGLPVYYFLPLTHIYDAVFRLDNRVFQRCFGICVQINGWQRRQDKGSSRLIAIAPTRRYRSLKDPSALLDILGRSQRFATGVFLRSWTSGIDLSTIQFVVVQIM